MARVILYNGVNAERYPSQVALSTDGWLRIIPDGGGAIDVPVDELTIADEDKQQLIVSRRNVSGWRLIIDQPVDAALRAALPGTPRYGRWIDRLGLAKASVALAVIAGGVLIVGHFAPHHVAPFVPPSWERNIGDAIVGDFGELRCRSPQGDAALNALVERLDPGATRPGPRQIRIAALDVGVFNAAAIPGAHIIVFKGAIDDTPNPDAMAGILAHEIAHVRRRHVTEALVRELGIGALIRTFAGGIGANAEQVVGLSFTRANEAQADADAIETLRRVGIDPRPTAALFERLSKGQRDTKGALEFLESHPGSKGRAANFARSFDPKAKYRPSLDLPATKALMGACAAPKRAPDKH